MTSRRRFNCDWMLKAIHYALLRALISKQSFSTGSKTFCIISAVYVRGRASSVFEILQHPRLSIVDLRCVRLDIPSRNSGFRNFPARFWHLTHGKPKYLSQWCLNATGQESFCVIRAGQLVVLPSWRSALGIVYDLWSFTQLLFFGSRSRTVFASCCSRDFPPVSLHCMLMLDKHQRLHV